MKVFFDAGLKEVAMVSGFRAETLTSLAKASKFKHTHAFFMQVWEAFISIFLDIFMTQYWSDNLSSDNM